MAQLLEQIESQKLRLLSIRENRTFPLQGHSTAIVSPAYCILNSEQVDAWSRLIQLEHEERCDLLKHFCDTQIKLLHFRDQLTQARCTLWTPLLQTVDGKTRNFGNNWRLGTNS